MRNLIKAGFEDLMDSKRYADRVNTCLDLADKIKYGVDIALATIKRKRYSPDLRAKTVAQALFDSGFVTETENCYNTGKLFQAIYGKKLHDRIAWIEESHSLLKAQGFTSIDNMFNSSGDNHFFCTEFKTESNENARFIYFQYQDYAQAIILTPNRYDTAIVGQVHLINLGNYEVCRDRLKELQDLNYDIVNNFDWEKLACHEYGIFNTLDVENMMMCDVLQPKLIEGMLFAINGLHTALSASK